MMKLISATILLAALALAGCGTGHAHPDVVRTVTVTRTVQAKPRTVTVTRWRTRTRTVTVPAGGPPTPSINGARWAITIDNCAELQCTALPGAGPMGSTCGAIVNNQQVCVGG